MVGERKAEVEINENKVISENSPIKLAPYMPTCPQNDWTAHVVRV